MTRCLAHDLYDDHVCTALCTDNECCIKEAKRVGFKVRVDVWVDVPNEASARGAVNRMVANSRECDNNGDVDIVDVQEWDYDG